MSHIKNNSMMVHYIRPLPFNREDAGHLASCLLPNASRIAMAYSNHVHTTSALEHALTVAKEAIFAHLFTKTSIPGRSEPMVPTPTPIDVINTINWNVRMIGTSYCIIGHESENTSQNTVIKDVPIAFRISNGRKHHHFYYEYACKTCTAYHTIISIEGSSAHLACGACQPLTQCTLPSWVDRCAV